MKIRDIPIKVNLIGLYMTYHYAPYNKIIAMITHQNDYRLHVNNTDMYYTRNCIYLTIKTKKILLNKKPHIM